MYKRTLILIAGSTLALAACGSNKANTTAAANNSAWPPAANATGPGATTSNGAATASTWPADARIVEENGVTYRVEAGGNRVRLEPGESRIVVENGVRYRVDRDGTRVRINTEGVRIGDSVIRGNAPNGRSDVETPGETATDAVEDAAEAVGDVVDPPRKK